MVQFESCQSFLLSESKVLIGQEICDMFSQVLCYAYPNRPPIFLAVSTVFKNWTCTCYYFESDRSYNCLFMQKKNVKINYKLNFILQHLNSIFDMYNLINEQLMYHPILLYKQPHTRKKKYFTLISKLLQT